LKELLEVGGGAVESGREERVVEGRLVEGEAKAGDGEGETAGTGKA
jgi:hypothetical protein